MSEKIVQLNEEDLLIKVKKNFQGNEQRKRAH